MKRLAGILLQFLCALSLVAGPVSHQQARRQAANFMQQRGMRLQGQVVAIKSGIKQSVNQPIYVFNAEDDKGFVVVSGDDRTDAILGYTLQGCYSEDDAPPALKEWMRQMTAEIEALAIETDIPQDNSGNSKSPKLAVHRAVTPLIKTKWDQGNWNNEMNTDGVYNIHLPKINGVYPCTGCVPAAGAQIMYYYQHPKTATKTLPGYTVTNSRGADTSVGLSPIKFKWDKMKTNYTKDDPDTDAVNAVADLMLYCGYAAKTNFGTGSSGANSSNLVKGMAEYFDFDPYTYKRIFREDYPISEWDEIIYGELSEGRPVIYSGDSNSGGHAFICDGYDGYGLYHFNWGWGGNYDGYYKLQATNPYGASDIGYIFNNDCIIGIQPNTGVVPPVAPDADDEWDVPVISGIVATVEELTANDDNTVTMKLFNYNDKAYSFGFGMGELKENGTIVVLDKKYERYKTLAPLDPYSGYQNMYFDVSSYNLADGTHKLVPLSILADETTWRRCKEADTWLEVKVSGGKVTSMIVHPVENLQVNKMELVSPGEPGNMQRLFISITNKGDNLKQKLSLQVDDAQSYYSSKTLKIAAGNTKEFYLYAGEIGEGQHVLRLCNAHGETLKTLTVNLKTALKATAFNVGGINFVDRTLPVDVTIENNAGDYTNPIYFFASTSTGNKGDCIYVAGTAIEGGGKEDVRFYFTPNAAGEWHLWAATDQSGTKVIGHAATYIVNPPQGTVTLELTDHKVVCERGGNVTYMLTVRNTGQTANYRAVRTWLWYDKGDGRWGASTRYKTPEFTLKPGQTQTVTRTLRGLEEGRSYTLDPEYPTTYGSETWQSLNANMWVDRFTYNQPATGDVNHDNDVNTADVAAIYSYIMSGEDSGFTHTSADVNGDNDVNTADVTAIYSCIINGSE